MSEVVSKRENPIRMFIEKIPEYTDAPIPFIQFGAYWTVSATLGHLFRIPEAPVKMSPNLWVLLSSIPGRMRRSTIQDYCKRIVKEVLKEYYVEGEKLPAEEAEVKVERTFIEEGTVEGIVDKIQNDKLKICHFFSTEFGTALKRAENLDYQAGVLGLLSKLYYGESYEQALSQRNGKQPRYLPPGIYATMFSGMQDPWEYITREMIRQGFLRRIAVVYVERADRWMPPLDPNHRYVDSALNQIAESLKDLLKTYLPIAKRSFGGKIDIHFAPEAMNLINSYAQIVEGRVDQDKNQFNIYCQTFWEHLMKHSTFNAMVRGELIEMKGEESLHVRPEDVKEAMPPVKFLEDNARMWVPKLGIKQMDLVSEEEILNKMVEALRSFPYGIANYSQWYSKVPMKTIDFIRRKNALIELGRVEEVSKDVLLQEARTDAERMKYYLNEVKVNLPNTKVYRVRERQ